MIRVLVVDDHPAVRRGLEGALRAEPGLAVAASAATAGEALLHALSGSVDVALLDFNLPDTDGLLLCRQLKRERPGLKVLIYSAFASEELKVPAAIAGADGLRDKGAPLDELLDLIRHVARIPAGEALYAPSPAARQSFGDRLDPADLPIMSMVLDGTPLTEIATTLAISESALEERIRAMIARPAARETLD